MTLILRPYQEASVDAVWSWLRMRDDPPVVCLPTGAGKTPVIAQLCADARVWGGRVLVVAHVRELLQQSADTLRGMLPDRMMEVGIYSAGMGRRDTDSPILVAGVQSIYRRAEELGTRDVVIVDEAHLIPHDGDGMYQQLLTDLRAVTPHCRLVGLTATPYRLDRGLIYGPEALFGGLAYEAPVRELIDEGYLCRLVGVQAREADVTGVRTRGGDFMAADLDERLSVDDVVAQACCEISEHCADRRAWLVFCSGVRHAEAVREQLGGAGIDCGLLTGQTPKAERDDLVERFKAGRLRCVVNVNVASIGFDAPHVDAVVMLRPTQSPGLYYQQVGRGLRVSPGKENCLVLDLAGNIRRHGPIDRVQPPRGKSGRSGDLVPEGESVGKTCPECAEIVAGATMTCPHCGYEWPPKHEAKADPGATPLAEFSEEDVEVDEVDYRVWIKKGTESDPTAPRTLCAEYRVGNLQTIREWICPEHRGYPRSKAERWWGMRDLTGGDLPDTAVDTYDQIEGLRRQGQWADPTSIRLRHGGKWPEVIGYAIETAEIGTGASYDPDEEVPF